VRLLSNHLSEDRWLDEKIVCARRRWYIKNSAAVLLTEVPTQTGTVKYPWTTRFMILVPATSAIMKKKGRGSSRMYAQVLTSLTDFGASGTARALFNFGVGQAISEVVLCP